MSLAFFELFFFNDAPTTEIYTLSLHDALPILIKLLSRKPTALRLVNPSAAKIKIFTAKGLTDRKSGSAGMPRPSSYAVFCLKKKTRPGRGSEEANARTNRGRRNAGTGQRIHLSGCT